MKHDILAEEVRQQHCERKEQPHLCMGTVTIDMEGMLLDCKLCGQTTESLEGIAEVFTSAKAICRLLGVDYNALCPKKRRELLIEVAGIRTY